MTATLMLDRKKYTRLANRIVIKAIESEEEYDRWLKDPANRGKHSAFEQLITRGVVRATHDPKRLLERMQIRCAGGRLCGFRMRGRRRILSRGCGG